MKALRKFLLIFTGTLVVVIAGTVISLFVFKDRIVQQFIREANKSLSTPVHIGKIDVTLLDDFPRLSIVFTDVYIEDSHPGTYPLLTAKTVSFSLNPWDVYRGVYVVEGLRLTTSETNLRIDQNGKTNYRIAKEDSEGGTVTFDLRNVLLTDTKVSYVDRPARQHHEFRSEQLSAGITARDNVYHIEALGDITIGQIGIGSSKFLEEKPLNVNAKIDYNDTARHLNIAPSELTLGKKIYQVAGTYHFKDKNLIDVHLSGTNTDIQSLLSLFPSSTTKRFAKYESRGDVYIEGRLRGEISRRRTPALTLSFGLRDATIVHPDYASRFDQVNLEGTFASTNLTRFNDAELSLQKITASMNGRPVTGNFRMHNFDDPDITLEFHGEPRAADLLAFYQVPDVTDIAGSLRAHVSLKGRVALLKSKATAQQVKTEGTVELDSISFTYGKRHLQFSRLSGSLQFDNNDLAMSNLRGAFERSDFLLNGYFKNIVTYALFPDQPIGIEADLTSSFLDVDRLFEVGFATTRKGPYTFSISPNLHLNFNCKIDSLTYKKFHASHVKGDLLVKGQVAVSRKIDLKAFGGNVSLSGIVDARNVKAIDLITSAELDKIYLDSVFYVFENFRQHFIEYKHLKGQADATITLEASLNEALRMFPETLIADVRTTLRNGELNNFEPIRALNKYLDDEGLNKLRFADLHNDIHIENKTVYIPQMEIRSNVTTIMLSGTHTFDQQIDYRVVAPLRNKKKIDPDEAFGAIEDDLTERAKLYLKIIGTTDNYKVMYDKVAVRKKIASDLKREVQELKEAFRLKGKKKKKELELQKDDYFDWENN